MFGITRPRIRAWLKSLAMAALAVLIEMVKPILLVLLRLRRRQPARSLWTGTPIINMAVCARAERTLGIQADSLVFYTYFISSEFTYDMSGWARGPAIWREVLLPFFVLCWACLRYQRFHFFCDRGLLPGSRFLCNEHELKLLRFLGKKIYLYAYGADVRTRKETEALGTFNCCTECPNPGNACVCDDAKGAAHQTLLTKYADAVFSMGDMIHYTPGSCNDLYYWPIDLEKDQGQRYAPSYPDPESTRPIRIVHAPNHRGFKGTHFLIEAVESLRNEGHALELVLVERVPNDQALEIYRTADIIFDQCLIGFHGYFALEAMAMGKPVMVFIRHPQEYLIAAHECPLVNTPADRVVDVLRSLLHDRQRLHALGTKGRQYIAQHHTLAAFARRLAQKYQDFEAPVGTCSKSRTAISSSIAA